MTRTLSQEQWAGALARFTERNAGRAARMEVDGRDFGAQEESLDAPLRGVSYDWHDRRISIMLGPLAGAEGHLTHTIDRPTEVAIIARDDGRDGVLHVANADEDTLLVLAG